MRHLLLVMLLLGTVALAHAAPEALVETCPTVTVPMVTGAAPVLDGKLDEGAWHSAARVGPFVSLSGQPARGTTTARLLCTNYRLWLGFECTLTPGKAPQANHTARDSDVYMDESVEVFADAGPSLQRYRHLLVNVNNVQRDETGDLTGTSPYDVTWNGQWESATSQAGGKWYAELSIPLAELGLNPDRPGLLGLNLCRNDSTTGESTCWAPTHSGFHVPQRFGVVSFGGFSPEITLSLADPGVQQPGQAVQKLTLKSAGAWPGPGAIQGREVTLLGRKRAERKLRLPALTNGLPAELAVPYQLQAEETTVVLVTLTTPDGIPVAVSKTVHQLPVVVTAPEFGYRLRGGEKLGLWWAESTYKIHRDKAAPTAASAALTMSAAGREYECAQLVVRPARDTEVALRVSNFTGPGGRLAARHFELLQEDYVPVTTATDAFGWPGDWPDPLPAVSGPVKCRANLNQPFWLRAYVPAGTAPGLYRGAVTVSADNDTLVVPVELRVRAFSLTPETHTRTAYGMSPDFGFLGVTDPRQQEKVYDLYLQNMRDHRMAPYDPLRYYQPRCRTVAPGVKLTLGRMSLTLDRGEATPWRLSWDGKEIANQATSMTHFEKEGVGWQGTGVSWPYVDGIADVREVSASPTMRVYEIVGVHTGSAPAQRSFKLTFRLYVPAGDNWFGWRLMKMESTDPTAIEVREYYNIPHTTFAAAQVANGNDFAAWSGDGLGFGMLCLDGGTGGLRVAPGAQGVTVSNPVTRFAIKQGETHAGWGPLVVYYVTDQTSPEALTARAAQLRQCLTAAPIEQYQPQQPAKLEVEKREDYSFQWDFTRLDEGGRKYLDGYRFNAFNLPCMPATLGGHARFTPDYKRLHALMYRPLIDHLREKGWLSKAYSYWYDEPEESAYPFVIAGMELLKTSCPGLQRLLTEQPEPALYGAVDLWVPLTGYFDPARNRARQLAGDEVWWYVCCGPRAPYANDFIDHPALNPRLRAWQAEKYGVTGELYWFLNWNGNKPDGSPKNPWTDAMSYTPDGGTWGNGDGFMLYPACRQPSKTPVLSGPVDSIRWEMLREGLEDREYFWLLREEMKRLRTVRTSAAAAALRQAEAALKTPDLLAESLTKYTRDPQALYAAREQLAAAVEACRRVR